MAPEIWPLHAARAWEVYEDAEDEVVGRVAVALTYAICSPVRSHS